MTESDHKNLLEQLNIKKRAIQTLEEQHAAFGNLYVPPYIKIQIEDVSLEITELQEKLRFDRSYGPRPPRTLPPSWNIPHYRNPNFSGRDSELATLKTALENSNITAVTQAIAGLGGVGKTQLAVEYAYREAANFALVWWVRAEVETSLRFDLEQLALTIGLVEQNTDPQRAIDAVLDFLQSKAGRWLLIFDNANNPTEVQSYLPKGGRGQIIITSRWQNWHGFAQPVPVKVWKTPQAVKFLIKRTGRKDKEGAAKLAEKLGYLPLALEHAGAYLAKNRTLSLVAYLEKFDQEQQKLALLEKGVLATEYHQDTIRTTWAMALEKLPDISADLLTLCAYLAPDEIPLSIFKNHASVLPESLTELATDDFVMSETISDLQEYSLVEPSKNWAAFSVHRLLQLVIRETNQNLTHSNQHFFLTTAVRLINAVSPTGIYDYRTWDKYVPILPHSLIVAEQAEPLELELGVLGRLINQAGLYLQGRGDYIRARLLFERALKSHRKYYGDEHLEVAAIINNLGCLLHVLGDLQNAKIYLEKAISIWEIAYGLKHTQTAIGYNNLGSLLQAIGELSNAKIYLEKALAIHQNTLGEKHPDLAQSYNNLGLLLHTLGDLSTAKTYLKKALVIYEKDLGEIHPNVATLNTNLGSLHQTMGDFINAKIHFDKAITIWEKTLGPEHSQTAIGYNNLGLFFKDLGDYANAKIHFDKAVTIWGKALSLEHAQTAVGYNNLGLLFQDLGDSYQAKFYFDKAITIWELTYGLKHTQTALGYNNLGSLFKESGDLLNARVYLEKALAISEIALGTNHPDVATHYNNLGSLLKDLDDLVNARINFEKAISIWEKTLGLEHTQTALGYNNLGSLFQAMGDFPSARIYIERAIVIWEIAYGLEHTQTAIGYNNLGLLLKNMGDLPNARVYLEKVLAIREKVLDKEHPDIAQSCNNLGMLLKDIGDLLNAQIYLEKALNIFEGKLVKDHPNTNIVRRNLVSLGES